MAVDKNLFPYDVAVVSTMYNESPYVKEWLDYHLLAGVDHFYIYDHESTDNLKEILQPYIESGIVTYTLYPSPVSINAVYNDAVDKYKFFCRYMAVIDGDEFIFPQNNQSIPEVLDKFFADKKQAAGLAINWHCFGSNEQETADYSKGVLERFTRRAPKDFAPPFPNGAPGGNAHIKTILNPRLVSYFDSPHFARYFENYFNVNEQGKIIPNCLSYPISVENILINHYITKSKEEAFKRRGKSEEYFNTYNRNEVFDDSILKYRESRLKMGGGSLERTINYQQLYSALLQNLSPTFVQNVSREFYQGKLETFLTCLKLAEYLREKVLDKDAVKIFEETALNAIFKSFAGNFSIADLKLLITELPEILQLNYPIVQNIRQNCVQILPQLINVYRLQSNWSEYMQLNHLLNLLKTFDNYNHK